MSALLLTAQRWSLLRVNALANRFRRKQGKPAHLQTGERGELEALFFLRRQGFRIIERRWRSPDLNGDVDLIAWEGDTLCFVEVKTRTARDNTPAASSVDQQKRRMLARMARSFLRTIPQDDLTRIPIRFDIVSVYLLGEAVECELVRNAFDSAQDDLRSFGV